jgi:phosphoribosyl 1,2-cyclic phosphodiesterase
MSLRIASLNSGSNGNCYFIGNEQEAVLIDAGLSYRETMKRMEQLGLDPQQLKAVFISHEHTDHISGLEQLSRKLNLPVYITEKTHNNTSLKLHNELVNTFSADVFVDISSLRILPFTKHHDASDPHSFMVSGNGVHVGVITDAGHACEDVINCFRQCDVVFLESNYCDEMLEKGNYPEVLKKRIRSKKGHLSNMQALDLFLMYKPSHLQLLILSHLSQNNNSPDTALSVFKNHAGNVNVVVASRDAASELFIVEASKNKSPLQPKALSHKPKQLSLFS